MRHAKSKKFSIRLFLDFFGQWGWNCVAQM